MEEKSRKDEHNNVHRALKEWHRDDSEGSTLDHLCLFNQYRNQGYSIRQAANNVLLDGMEILEKTDLKYPKLLRWRFIDKQSVQGLSKEFSLSHTMVYRLQKEAIGRLAEILHNKELEMSEKWRKILEKGPEPRVLLEPLGSQSQILSPSLKPPHPKEPKAVVLLEPLDEQVSI